MVDNNDAWALAMAEVEDAGRRDSGLWAKCFAEANGDEPKAKAAYIKAKVGKSTKSEFVNQHKESRGWCPICHSELDIDALHCTACASNLAAMGRTPLKYKPTSPPLSQSHDRQVIKAAKSRGIYIILGLFFGLLGVHNFYAGRYGVGAAQLVITGVLGWFVVGLFITAIWVIIELFTVKDDGSGDAMS